jgi:hypothetical protein
VSEFKRERRYVVVKISDINAAGCTQQERDAFNALCDKVALYRNGAGKGPLECVVVESDWPEYEPTWEAIQRRMEGRQPTALPAIGESFGGGFFAGEITVAGERYALVVAPKAAGEALGLGYKKTDRGTADGAYSDDDGLANSEKIADDNHPAASFCRSLRIGGHDDWYLPSREELAMLYHNLGPNRPTAPALYKAGAAEAFEEDWYWSSTEYAPYPYYAWYVNFGLGNQYYTNEYYTSWVRAVRRIKLTI